LTKGCIFWWVLKTQPAIQGGRRHREEKQGGETPYLCAFSGMGLNEGQEGKEETSGSRSAGAGHPASKKRGKDPPKKRTLSSRSDTSSDVLLL